METAASPSASATAMAAVTIRSSVRPGLGPRLGRSPVPHRSSRLRAMSPPRGWCRPSSPPLSILSILSIRLSPWGQRNAPEAIWVRRTRINVRRTRFGVRCTQFASGLVGEARGFAMSTPMSMSETRPRYAVLAEGLVKRYRARGGAGWRSGRSTGSTSPSAPAPSTACSAPTEPGRPPPYGFSRPSCGTTGPGRGGRDRRGARAPPRTEQDRARRSVRRRRRGPHRAAEPGDVRAPLPPGQPRGPAARRGAAGTVRPGGGRRPERQGVQRRHAAAGSTSPPR